MSSISFKRTTLLKLVKLNRFSMSDVNTFCSTTKSDGYSHIVDLKPFPVVYAQENLTLHQIFRKHGYDLRIAGGAVRDILLGISPHDIDYATNATPPQMIDMFNTESIRMLNKNGEAHGTVTVRINDKENFEVTTLRIDSKPDGRHCEVIFTDDWRLDAERRDLTVNSMFLGIDVDKAATDSVDNDVKGHLYDFFNGEADLANRRIRFVGNADVRIKEDYLRILRYFRFHGKLVQPVSSFSATGEGDDADSRVKNIEQSHDQEALKAIEANASGLARIAGERLWVELKKILCYPNTPTLIRLMQSTGCLSHLGLSRDVDLDELDQAWRRGLQIRQPNPATCLTALVKSTDEIRTLVDRLRLSNQEVGILAFIVNNRDRCPRPPPPTSSSADIDQVLKFYQRELLVGKAAGHESPNKLAPILAEMMRYLGYDSEVIRQWTEWQVPKFPVNGRDLQVKWQVAPRQTSKWLFELRKQWVDSEYQLTSDQLLQDDNKGKVLAANPDLALSSASNSTREGSGRFIGGVDAKKLRRS